MRRHLSGLEAHVPEFRVKPDVGGLFREDLGMRPGAHKRFSNIKVRDHKSFDEEVMDFTLDWLDSKGKEDEPWTLFVGLHDPHFPFFYKKKYWDYYEPLVKDIPEVAKAPFPELNGPLQALRQHFGGDKVDEKTVLDAHIAYYAMVSELDEHIGMIMDKLSEKGLDQDTLVIYTSDHGEQLGHHGLWWKCCMYENSAHIPLVVRGPKVAKGKRTSAPASLVDIFPSLADALNYPLPKDVQGISLKSQWEEGSAVPDRDFVFSEYHGHGMPVGVYMVKWQQWKYLYYADGQEQLYDLETDPQEMKDLLMLEDRGQG